MSDTKKNAMKELDKALTNMSIIHAKLEKDSAAVDFNIRRLGNELEKALNEKEKLKEIF